MVEKRGFPGDGGRSAVSPAPGKPSPVTFIRNPCLSLLPDRGARREERGLCWEKPAPSVSGAPGGISGYLLPLLLC